MSNVCWVILKWLNNRQCEEGGEKNSIFTHYSTLRERERGRRNPLNLFEKFHATSLNWTKCISRSFLSLGAKRISITVIINPTTDSFYKYKSAVIQHYLLSGGTRTLWGHPDRLLWCGYRPVTWPVPSQPGVGHFMSFLSVRGESAETEKQDFTINRYNIIHPLCCLNIPKPFCL